MIQVAPKAQGFSSHVERSQNGPVYLLHDILFYTVPFDNEFPGTSCKLSYPAMHLQRTAPFISSHAPKFLHGFDKHKNDVQSSI